MPITSFKAELLQLWSRRVAVALHAAKMHTPATGVIGHVEKISGDRLASRRMPASGQVAPGFEPVARLFQKLVGRRTGGGALAVKHGGERLVDLWTGSADRYGHRPWTPETLSISFSTTKGVASTVIHRLADRGELDYDEPVATYWPEFAAGGKAGVTVRHLLTHRAGLHSVRAVAQQAEDLLDHVELEHDLAARAVKA